MFNNNMLKNSVVISALVFLGACSSNAQRPDTLAIQARESVRKAESVGAPQKAPLAFRDAEQYLTKAEGAMGDKDYEEAQFLLEKSMINSELAIARSGAVDAKKAAEEIDKNLETLQNEVE